jgi:hypothetical protein
MYDYLTELHQTSTENSEEQQLQQQDRIHPDGSISVINSPYDIQQEKVVHHEEPTQQRRSGRSLFSCGCSRTISGDNIHQSKSRNRQNHRICSLS